MESSVLNKGRALAGAAVLGLLPLLCACGEEAAPAQNRSVAGAGGLAGGATSAGGTSAGTGGATAGASGSSATGGTGGAGSGGSTGGSASVNCAALVISGDRTTNEGATWTYQSTDDGIPYSLEGVLFSPAGEGPFPGVVINHGKDGTVFGYSAMMAREFMGWGMIAIGTMLGHANDAEDEGNLPPGDEGRSEGNVLRAKKAYDLLSCLPADPLKRAVHAHSMGGFATGQLLGTYPGLFMAASHSAGGVSLGPAATTPEAAALITTPYQLHHGDMDMVVLLMYDQELDATLEANGVPHELHVYQGYDHADIVSDPLMFERVRTWYTTYGVLP
jgi:dienelactone hydrolase